MLKGRIGRRIRITL